MTELEDIVICHPAFQGLEAELGRTIADCARDRRFSAGTYLFREGEPADEFFLIREGRAALEITAPGHPPRIFSSVGSGEILGLSWLAPPYRWSFDARAIEPLHAIGIDARCLRGKCEADHHLGYELMKRLFSILIPRLHAARLQMLDLYGTPRR